MDVVLSTIGAGLVLAGLLDVFFTVLFPASTHGPIRKGISQAVWQAFRAVARLLHGRWRRNLLAYCGPSVIAATIAGWLLVLLIGWAMIFKPALGSAIQASSGPTDTGWVSALYFSGFNLTTLGVGDLVPEDGYRLLAVAAAATGFSFFSMVITYFLTVYGSLVSRNAFAQGLHHQTGGTDDAGVLLAAHADGADLSGLKQCFASSAQSLRQVYQSLHFYPVLRYFHFREPHSALPRVLLTALDGLTLARSALDPERYGGLIHGAAASELEQVVWSLLHDAVPTVRSAPTDEERRIWRAHYAAGTARLAAAGVRLRPDAAEGAEDYVRLRAHWAATLAALGDAMLHEWDAAEGSTPDPAAAR